MSRQGRLRWAATRLWQELDGRCEEPTEQFARYIALTLPKAEAVLDSGNTMPTTFTLHDSEHSRRVAERITDLAGTDLLSSMGPYDVGLLLLSAYLHDIGMTPPLSRLDSVMGYLLSGDPSTLGDEEREPLLAWLDNETNGTVSPLNPETPTTSDLQHARQLTAAYVRERHNDWSAAWIEANLADLDEHAYSGCLTDLIALCRSHHFGIDELRADAFDPRYVGTPATVLHLRFAACLLRVADVLDFDPERTPPILYSHRGVDESSAIFWHKDHELSFMRDGTHISIHARPPNAVIDQAIRCTVADVEQELHLCARLADETQFQRMSGHSADLPHRWTLDTTVKAVIKPRNSAYEYMDGTFRPDQERILDLLGGTALYGSPLAAVRELLQNAFDAVREEIAHQRLKEGDPTDRQVLERISDNQSVALILERSESGVQLICRDTGVGMSKDIIASRFLIGGRTVTHETKQLERACEEREFSVGRTARFGIGVLAYFLLASYLEVQTRRSPSAGDPDSIGWTFSTHGLTDFGELKRNSDCPIGTEVRLTIPMEAMPNGIDDFANELAKYVRETVRRVPCRFSFVAPDWNVEPFSSGPGWVAREEEAAESFLRPLRAQQSVFASNNNDEIFLSVRQKEFERNRSRWQTVLEHASSSLRIDTEEGDLPDGLGAFRLFIGHFDLCDDSLLAYMDVQQEAEGTHSVTWVDGSHAVELASDTWMGWNGMNVRLDLTTMHDFDAYDPKQPNVIVEIDWTDDGAGEIAIDRNTFKIAAGAIDALEFVRRKALQSLTAILRDNRNSPFALINARIANVAVVPDGPALWPRELPRQSPATQSSVELMPLTVPAIDIDYYESQDLQNLLWRGDSVSALRTLRVMESGSSNASDYSWHGSVFAPQAVGARSEDGLPRPVLIWTRIEAGPTMLAPLGPLVDFPPEWRSLVSLQTIGDDGDRPIRVWNPKHPLIQSVDAASWEWATRAFRHSIDPLPHVERLTQSTASAAAWVLLCLVGGKREVWNAAAERSAEFIPGLWGSIEGLDDMEAIFYWDQGFRDGVLGVLTDSYWRAAEDDSYRKLVLALGEPSDDWWLTTREGERELPLA